MLNGLGWGIFAFFGGFVIDCRWSSSLLLTALAIVGLTIIDRWLGRNQFSSLFPDPEHQSWAEAVRVFGWALGLFVVPGIRDSLVASREQLTLLKRKPVAAQATPPVVRVNLRPAQRQSTRPRPTCV
jgi:hypothetical protein